MKQPTTFNFKRTASWRISILTDIWTILSNLSYSKANDSSIDIMLKKALRNWYDWKEALKRDLDKEYTEMFWEDESFEEELVLDSDLTQSFSDISQKYSKSYDYDEITNWFKWSAFMNVTMREFRWDIDWVKKTFNTKYAMWISWLETWKIVIDYFKNIWDDEYDVEPFLKQEFDINQVSDLQKKINFIDKLFFRVKEKKIKEWYVDYVIDDWVFVKDSDNWAYLKVETIWNYTYGEWMSFFWREWKPIIIQESLVENVLERLKVFSSEIWELYERSPFVWLSHLLVENNDTWDIINLSQDFDRVKDLLKEWISFSLLLEISRTEITSDYSMAFLFWWFQWLKDNLDLEISEDSIKLIDEQIENTIENPELVLFYSWYQWADAVMMIKEEQRQWYKNSIKNMLNSVLTENLPSKSKSIRDRIELNQIPTLTWMKK